MLYNAIGVRLDPLSCKISDRASDAAAYIEHGNVVSIGHHSSVVLHIIMW